jgi:hypothetical protein
MKNFLALFILLACSALAEEGSNDLAVEIEQKNLLLTVVSWPFEYIVQPAIEFLMYPIIPPLIYISRENLIDKGENLITYGENRQIRFYPLMNLKLGNSASSGFAYWHSNLFLDDDNLFLSPHLYINADWDVSFRYKKTRIFGTSFYWGFNTSYREDGNNSFNVPNKITYSFADSSVYFNTYSGFNLLGNWWLELGTALNFHRFSYPSLNEIIIDDQEASNRGFYKSYESYPVALSLLHNSLDEPYSATKGRKFSLSYGYVPVSSYGGSKDHNYHFAESRLVNYSLLGNKTYAMTVAESDLNREKLKNFSFSEAIEILNPINIKEVIYDRRVLITQLKARYMIEENAGKAPFTAMNRLGESFPLRAYGDGYFTAPLVLGISAEYRWPIDRFADALIFNEYATYAEDFSHLFEFGIRNSYGFGFRIRTSKLFIFRFSIAFHGLHGISLILTTRPEYD